MKTVVKRPVLAKCTTVSFHQNIVTTGFTGSLSAVDRASSVRIPDSTAPQTTIRKQEGRELIAD